jgi:hypothetical protein
MLPLTLVLWISPNSILSLLISSENRSWRVQFSVPFRNPTQLLLYSRESKPFGKSWEEWAASWCKWLLSLPKDVNPSLDDTGENCFQNQEDPNVWYLGGSFGNIVPIIRFCRIPKHRAILFPILEKEDSFAEDVDLKYESDLRLRAKEFMDRVRKLQVTVDGIRLQELHKYRVQSSIFDLNFPTNCVYDVEPGFTKAVCDGYWVFLRPLSAGQHEIQFSGEVAMISDDTVTDQFRNDPLYAHIKEHIERNVSFVLDITYQIIVA